MWYLNENGNHENTVRHNRPSSIKIRNNSGRLGKGREIYVMSVKFFCPPIRNLCRPYRYRQSRLKLSLLHLLWPIMFPSAQRLKHHTTAYFCRWYSQIYWHETFKKSKFGLPVCSWWIASNGVFSSVAGYRAYAAVDIKYTLVYWLLLASSHPMARSWTYKQRLCLTWNIVTQNIVP